MSLIFKLFFVASLPFYFLTVNAQTVDELKQIADNFYYSQKFDSSLFYAQKAGAILKKDSGEYSRPYAYFIGQFYGFNYHKLNDLATEVYWYKESIRIFEKLHDTLSTEYAETLTNYGELITGFGSFSEAEPYLLKAEAILRPYALEFTGYAGTLNNLANVYNYKGQYAKAEAIFADVLSLLKKTFKSDTIYHARVYNNLGSIYNKTGLWKRSEQNFKEAIRIFKKVNAGKIELYTAMLNLGQMYAAQERTSAAITIFKEVTDSTSPPQYIFLHALALNGMGQAMKQYHKRQEAKAYYLKALKELQQDERGARLYYAFSSNLGLLYAEIKSPKADSLYRAMFINLAQSKDREQYSYLKIYSEFCANLIKSGKLGEASDSLRSLSQYLFQALHRNFEGMPHYEKLQFAESLKANFDLIYSLLASGKTTSQMVTVGLNNLLHTKGMILTNQTDIYKEVRHSADTTVTKAYRNWQTVQQILYKQYALPGNERIFNTDSLEAQSEIYERKFSVNSSAGIRQNEDNIVEKISQSMLPGEAAIEFVRFNLITAKNTKPVYGAFILKQGKPDPVFVMLCKEQQLQHLFKTEKGKAADAGTLTKKLYRQGDLTLYSLLWKPMEPYLEKCKNIYYSSAGIINSIALNTVSTGNSSVLMDKYNLILTADTKSIADKTKKKDNIEAAAIWGDMNYDKAVYVKSSSTLGKQDDAIDKGLFSEDMTKGGGFAEYWKPINNKEVDNLKEILSKKKIKVTTYKGVQATEENFKKVANGSKGILHISTHGFFAPAKPVVPGKVSAGKMFTTHVNPLLRCGLVFSGANSLASAKASGLAKDDGILTGYEIAQMDLSQVDLVVLSACETGLGDISAGDEGVMGLQRAFRLAGAKKLVVSLWQVPQQQTAELMEGFYKKLVSGQKPSEALLLSQKELRSKKYLPFHWAGFVAME